jgi:hypothetical protein
MSEYFRIVRGLELDETVRILQGAIPPGSTADTDAALVGSFYLNNTTGTAYTKILAGSGTNKWSAVGSGTGLQLYDENPSTPSTPVAAGTNSVAIGNAAATDVAASQSLALGPQSVARHANAMVYAGGRFASSGDAQTGKYLLRTVTTNATPAEAFLDGTGGSLRLVLPDDSTWVFTARVVGHRTDANDGHAGYRVEGVIFRKAGAATVAFQGVPAKTVLAESNAPWDINITADTGNGSLKVAVTGQVGKTIRWLASVETVEVTN